MKRFTLILICILIVSLGAFYFWRPATETPEQDPVTATNAAPSPSETAVVKPATIQPATVEVKEPDAHLAERASKPLQTLTDTQGRQIQAKILSVNGDQVQLRRSDGLETTIPMSMLSADDITFCEYLRDQPTQTASRSNGPIDWDRVFNP